MSENPEVPVDENYKELDLGDIDKSLPRIVVTEDSITVLESLVEEVPSKNFGDWTEKNVEREDDADKDLTDEDIEKFLDSGVVLESEVGEVVDNLEKFFEEEKVDDVSHEGEGFANENFYKTKKVGELYEGVDYNVQIKAGDDVKRNYEEFVELEDLTSFVDLEEARKKRSMLEISGFKDEEAEKKRESSRRY